MVIPRAGQETHVPPLYSGTVTHVLVHACGQTHTHPQHTHLSSKRACWGTGKDILSPDPTATCVAGFANFLAVVLRGSFGDAKGPMMITLDPRNSRGPRGLGTAQTMVTGWAPVSEASRVTPSISLTEAPFTPSGWLHLRLLHPPSGEGASSFHKGCLSTVA